MKWETSTAVWRWISNQCIRLPVLIGVGLVIGSAVSISAQEVAANVDGPSASLADADSSRFFLRPYPPPGVALFEFSMLPQFLTYLGGGADGPCMGGGGSGPIRLTPAWQIVVDVSGCKPLGIDEHLSGDSLSYLAGARRTFQASHRWSAHAQFLIGGTKLTQERINPQLEQTLDLLAEQADGPRPQYSAHSQHWETNGFTSQAGTGVEIKLHNALSMRMAEIGYSRSWSNEINGFSFQRGLQFNFGLALRMGTW
jgi:hypothetical protein